MVNRLSRERTADNKYINRWITYDTKGNINTLSRIYSGTVIDSLAYTYTAGANVTNQLQSLLDKSADAGRSAIRQAPHHRIHL